MKRFISLFVFLFFLMNVAFAQRSAIEFSKKKNQHTIDVDIASISYAFAHRYQQNLTLGVRLNVGVSFRALLTNPSFYYDCDQCGGPTWEHVRASGPFFFDLLKVQLFYRYHLPKHFYFDAGPYYSYGFNNFEIINFANTTGLEASAMYHFWLVHVGLRMQAGWQFFQYANGFKTNYFGVFVTPLVIGFQF